MRLCLRIKDTSSWSASRQPCKLSERRVFHRVPWKMASRSRFSGDFGGKPIWIETRFLVSAKNRPKTSDREAIVAEMSVLEWKVMSRLVRRLPSAANVVDGAVRSCRVASGLICGPMKRMAVHWELRRAMPRLVTAREQARSQLKCVALAVFVEVWMYSMSCSSAESWRRRSFIS